MEPVTVNCSKRPLAVKVKNRNKSNELLALAKALDGESPKGISLLRVATKSNVSIERVKELLTVHTDYFVNVGGKGVFALNRFGPFKGKIEEIEAAIEREAVAAEKRMRRAASGAIHGL